MDFTMFPFVMIALVRRRDGPDDARHGDTSMPVINGERDR